MDFLSSFGTNFEALNAVLLQESVIFLGDLFGGVITLVDETEDVLIIIGILFSLLDPKLFQILEWLDIIDITH